MKEIYDLIKKEEKKFNLFIPITKEWDWNFPDHVNTTILYKNSVFKKGKDDNKPFKNITRPLLSLQYRAEGFDVKDIVLYIEEHDKDFQSFLIRKYHDKWAVDNNLEDFIDKLVESFVDFGGALVKKTKGPIPEVIPLQRLAFCDQSDMLGGPICEKHYYSPTELRKEAKGKNWKNVEKVIELSEKLKNVNDARKVETPGKHIEIYELHGTFPRYCLYDEEYDGEYDEEDLVGQVHLCAFYNNNEGKDEGISIFKSVEKDDAYKVILRDEIYGRALGLGGGEELFQDQIWTNYGMIRLKQLLDSASKVLFKTTDPKFSNRNKTDNLDNGEILVLDPGHDIGQLDSVPRSTPLFDRFVQDWEVHAQRMSAASDSMFGNAPTAGTPFKSLELQVAESHSLHEYRKTKLANFLSGIYHDWIVPKLIQSIVSDEEFMAELDMDELQYVAEGLVNSNTNKYIKDSILNGVMLPEEAVSFVRERAMESFLKDGNKRFLKILKEEFTKAHLNVKINISGKQANLSEKVDKLTNVMRFMLSTYDPNTKTFAVFEDPRMMKIFYKIIENSGLEPSDFSARTSAQVRQVPQEATRPLQQMGKGPELMQTVSNK